MIQTLDPTKNVVWDWQMVFEKSYLITADTKIVTSPDGKGVILVGVGDEDNQPTTTIIRWYKIGFNWDYKNMNQTLNVARKGFVVVPVSDKWTSCSKYLTGSCASEL